MYSKLIMTLNIFTDDRTGSLMLQTISWNRKVIPYTRTIIPRKTSGVPYHLWPKAGSPHPIPCQWSDLNDVLASPFNLNHSRPGSSTTATRLTGGGTRLAGLMSPVFSAPLPTPPSPRLSTLGSGGRAVDVLRAELLNRAPRRPPYARRIS